MNVSCCLMSGQSGMQPATWLTSLLTTKLLSRERLNHHCSSNARRSQHQDWRKAQPPLLIECKEITTPGLEKGSTTTAHPMQGDHNTRTGERLNHHCSSNARRSQHQDWRKAQPPLLIQCKEITTPGLEKGSTTTAHPMQGDHNTRTGERLSHHCSPNARRSQHQDWRKAQPSLLIQCKEITTPGLEKGSTTTSSDELFHSLCAWDY